MRQVGVALAMCTLALAVCCAIIASSDLGSGKTSLLQVRVPECVALLRMPSFRAPRDCPPLLPTCIRVHGQVIPYGLVVAPRRILYGLGSGEEQDAANQNEVAWGTFAGQDAYAEDLLGDEHYLVQFEDALHSDAVSPSPRMPWQNLPWQRIKNGRHLSGSCLCANIFESFHVALCLHMRTRRRRRLSRRRRLPSERERTNTIFLPRSHLAWMLLSNKRHIVSLAYGIKSELSARTFRLDTPPNATRGIMGARIRSTHFANAKSQNAHP